MPVGKMLGTLLTAVCFLGEALSRSLFHGAGRVVPVGTSVP